MFQNSSGCKYCWPFLNHMLVCKSWTQVLYKGKLSNNFLFSIWWHFILFNLPRTPSHKYQPLVHTPQIQYFHDKTWTTLFILSNILHMSIYFLAPYDYALSRPLFNDKMHPQHLLHMGPYHNSDTRVCYSCQLFKPDHLKNKMSWEEYSTCLNFIV